MKRLPLVLQKVLGIPNGVGLGCQPLSSILEAQLRTSYLTIGTISMQGGLKASEAVEEEDDVALSASIEQFKEGKITCVLGHAESWLSNTAQEILDCLQEKALILFNFLDEAHIPLGGHWDSFRPQMKLVPGMLRGRSVRGSPMLAMTATLTLTEEVSELQKILGLRSSNTVVLHSNPIQSHHKYVRYGKNLNQENL